MTLLRQASLFSLVGVANTIVALLIIYLAKHVGGFGDITANLIGYSVGITQSFFLNSRYTFAYNGNRIVASLRFLCVMAVGYLLNLLTVVFCINELETNRDLSHLVGVIPYTLFTFLSSKFWAFSANSRTGSAERLRESNG